MTQVQHVPSAKLSQITESYEIVKENTYKTTYIVFGFTEFVQEITEITKQALV